MIIGEQAYLEEWMTPPSERLAELERETWQKLVNPRMCSGAYQGRWLSLISKLLRPSSILELGTFSGYSTLCLLEGLDQNGELLTVDINEELAWIHQKYLTDHRIRNHYMSAAHFIDQNDLSKIELVFLDADKSQYLKYLESLTHKLSSGAILLVDNVLWNGKVFQAIQPGDKDTQVLHELNKTIARHPCWEAMIIPIRDGITLARKK
jgi:predicted O-methyltransferase YrrM